MEYQYRVYEQEMYIIKLKQSLLGEKKNYEDLRVVDLQIEILEEERNDVEHFRRQLEYLEETMLQEVKRCELEEKHSIGDEFKKKWRPISHHYEDDEISYGGIVEKLYSKDQHKEYIGRNPYLMKRLNEYDPNYEIEDLLLHKMGAFEVESYLSDHKIRNMLNDLIKLP